MGSPWIFSQINAYLLHGKILPDPPLSKKMLTLVEQAELMCQYKDPYIAMLQIRKHAAWYIKGLPGASLLRQRAFKISSLDELKKLAFDIVDQNSAKG